jgi:aspartyl-tRNA(Asn)/glutamyl-tRNA(Gln) amidotransferase subunit B
MIGSKWHPYEPVIGLEVHVRLGLNTKIFCDDPYSYGQEPNTLISPISLAYPGTLPRVNKKAIEFAIKMGLACKSEIASEVDFDRKNYFYPDLPKGYQLTQDRHPICNGGTIPIKSDGNIREVQLTKIHLEEDAGKSIHMDGDNFTHVDFNRAGTALIEMVTDPVLRTPEEAYSLMYEVRRLVRALGIGNGNMEQGSLRCDANVSIREVGTTALGTKVEIKNVNSFNNVKRAISLEIERQISLKNGEGEIISESRSFDPTTGKTASMRTKETLTDYRYFPDPDLTPSRIDESWINDLKSDMPELPIEKELRYHSEYNLSRNDASVLTDNSDLSEYFERVVSLSGNAKSSANWVMGPVKSVLNEQNIKIHEFPIVPEKLAEIIKWVDLDKVSQNFASKQLFPSALSYPCEELESILGKTEETGAETEELNNIGKRSC